MGRNIVQVKDLHIELQTVLDEYSARTAVAVDMLSEEAVKRIAKETKTTAPVGKRGKFKRSITSGVKEQTRYMRTHAWYVKKPEYRLTHLLVHGHAKRNGGRTDGNPFLHNATDNVVKWYEAEVEKVLQNGGRR